MSPSTSRTGLFLSASLALALFLPVGALAPAAGQAGAGATSASLVKKPPAPKAKAYEKPKVAKKVERSKGAVAERDWTVMYYLDADCNLEAPMLDDIDELEMIGSTDNVNLLVLLDRTPEHDKRDGNWSNSRLLFVTRDNTNGKIKSKVLEQSRGDGHRQSRDARRVRRLRDAELPRQALRPGARQPWRHLDGDAQRRHRQRGRDAARPVHRRPGGAQGGRSSEARPDRLRHVPHGPGRGDGRHRALRLLRRRLRRARAGPAAIRTTGCSTRSPSNPKMSPREFAQTMVKEWTASYAEEGEATVTSSATDLGKVPDLVAAVDALAAALGQAPEPVQAAAARARAATHYYGGEEGGGEIASFDLGEFAGAPRPAAGSGRDQAAGWTRSLAAVKAAVVEHGEGEAHKGSTGLAIYFPANRKVHADYASIPFARGGWDEFLKKGLAGAARRPQGDDLRARSRTDPSPGPGSPGDREGRGGARPASGPRSASATRTAASRRSATRRSRAPAPGTTARPSPTTSGRRSARIGDGKNTRLAPTTPLSPGSPYVRADASYNSLMGDLQVATIFDSRIGQARDDLLPEREGRQQPDGGASGQGREARLLPDGVVRRRQAAALPPGARPGQLRQPAGERRRGSRKTAPACGWSTPACPPATTSCRSPPTTARAPRPVAPSCV